jgi:hypothetical protein
MPRTTRKTTLASTSNQTPEQIAYEMPIGAALEGFTNASTEQDRAIAETLFGALLKAVDSVRDVPGIGGLHLSLAATRLAYMAVLDAAQNSQLRPTGTIH